MAEALSHQLDDITECSICRETLMNPKVLPCVHTFCLKCLDAWKQTKPADVNGWMVCPLCQVPADGFRQLPGNVFVEKMLAMKRLAGQAGSLRCEICDNDGADDSRVPPATAYCTDSAVRACATSADVITSDNDQVVRTT